MPENKSAEELAEEMGGVEVTELDDDDLEDVAGGKPNGNCGNTQCCGGELE